MIGGSLVVSRDRGVPGSNPSSCAVIVRSDFSHVNPRLLLVGPVWVYCDWVGYSCCATPIIPVWQHLFCLSSTASIWPKLCRRGVKQIQIQKKIRKKNKEKTYFYISKTTQVFLLLPSSDTHTGPTSNNLGFTWEKSSLTINCAAGRIRTRDPRSRDLDTTSEPPITPICF